MLNAIRSLAAQIWRPVYRAATGRSAQWPSVRRKHLAQHPSCAVCGGTSALEVHHVKPVHLFPALELDPSNLLTLCGDSEVLGISCYRVFGHAGKWTCYVPRVVENARLLLPQIQQARAA